MDNWFQNVWFIRAASLALAILLYVFVNVEGITGQDPEFIPNGSNEVQILDDIPVDIRIDSERFVVSGVPEFVVVSLEGVNSVLTPIVMQRSFTVFVDLEGLGEGEHTVDLEHDNTSSDLSIYIEPKTIEVTIEERATDEFPVTVDIINLPDLPAGYELGEPAVNPGTITITSSKSVIEQIAMVKAFVDVAGITESIDNREVPVNVYDSQGNVLNVRVKPETVVVSVDVDNPSKVVDVTVPTTGKLPDGFSLISLTQDIEEMEVFAISEILEEIDEVSTEEIDLSEISETGTIDVKLDLPDGVHAAEETIVIDIELEQEKEIEDVPIVIENEQAGQEVSFIKPGERIMDLTVTGNEKMIRALTIDDFRLFIDIRNLSTGEHNVPVTVEGPDKVKVSEEFDEVTIEVF